MPECITMPGTLTNVTPDMLAPTMPKATMYHGDCLPALKNDELPFSPPLAAIRLTPRSTKKYPMIMAIIILRLQIYKNESETANFSPFSLGHLQNPVLIFTTDSSDKHGELRDFRKDF
jgi:hypothetical protein